MSSHRRFSLPQIALGIGAVAVLVGLIFQPDRLWNGLLVASFGLLGFGLAGALAIAVQYGHRAPGAVGLRRVGEWLTALLPYGAAGLLVVLLARPDLYPPVEPHGGFDFRAVWLNRGFHLGRALLYLVVWIVSARALTRVSRLRAAGDSPALAARHGRLAGMFFYLLGVTLTCAAIDWLMALDPYWYSTIIGLYQFAGLALAGTGLFVIVLLTAPRTGELSRAALPELRHDLGQLLLALSCLWLYLWFSQFLLIWYTGLPEESTHYVARLQGGWRPLFYLNLLINGVIPFLLLLPREAKRSATVLLQVGALLLLGRYVDLHLWSGPPIVGDGPALGPLEFGFVIGLYGLIVLVLRRAAEPPGPGPETAAAPS